MSVAVTDNVMEAGALPTGAELRSSLALDDGFDDADIQGLPSTRSAGKRRRASGSREYSPPKRLKKENEQVLKNLALQAITDITGAIQPDQDQSAQPQPDQNTNGTSQNITNTDQVLADSNKVHLIPGATRPQNHDRNTDGQLDPALDSEADDNDVFADLQRSLRRDVLPIIDRLASRTIECLSRCSVEQLKSLSDKSESDALTTWRSLQDLLRSTRKVFNIEGDYIKTVPNETFDIREESVIWKVNLATVLSNMLQADVQMLHRTHEVFPNHCFPQHHAISGRLLNLYFELKMQLYQVQNDAIDFISSPNMMFPEEDALIKDIEFIKDLDEPTRKKFRDRCASTRTEIENQNLSIDEITRSHPRRFLFKAMSDCLRNDYSQYAKPSLAVHTTPAVEQQDSSGLAGSIIDVFEDEEEDDDDDDFLATVNQTAQEIQQRERNQYLANTDNAPRNTISDFSPFMNTLNGETRAVHQSPYAVNSTYAQSLAAQVNIPETDPSESTLEAYEKARIAVTARVSAKQRAAAAAANAMIEPGQNPNPRRPWSTEEENALMQGLDRVRGPYWSQILLMHGADGTVSEVLRDRNQVQLKDKARNLKLFFLKNGHEVPEYLRNVTGELKTRAPARMRREQVADGLRESAGEDRRDADAMSALVGNGGAGSAFGNNDRSESGGFEEHDEDGDQVQYDSLTIKDSGKGEQRKPEDDVVMASAIQQALSANS